MQRRTRNVFYALVIVLALIIAGWAFYGIIARRALAPQSRGDEEGSMVFDNRQRTFLLHLPPNYDGRTELPLVIVMHGGGGNAKSAERMTGFSPKSDREGFIVVYPEGTGRFTGTLLTWNSGNCCGYALDNNVNDVRFIRALLEKLQKELKVDSSRIFATGISNGGMMSYWLGCELADMVAAIAPVAGALNVENCSPSQPLSLIAFHGTADQNVLYDGGEPKKRADPRPRIDKSVSYAISFWVQNDRCTTVPQREEKSSIVIDMYTGCLNGSSVALYTILGGGHAWPGGDRLSPILDEPTHEVSATDVIWDFFVKHPKQSSNPSETDNYLSQPYEIPPRDFGLFKSFVGLGWELRSPTPNITLRAKNSVLLTSNMHES